MSEPAIAALSTEPELEEIPRVRNIEVWARLKKSSKYYHQGLIDPTNSKSRPLLFRLTHFTPTWDARAAEAELGNSMLAHFGAKLSRDAYVLHFNNNTYRIEDCELFLLDATNHQRFVRIL